MLAGSMATPLGAIAPSAAAAAVQPAKTGKFNPKCLGVITNEYGIVVALQFFEHKGKLCAWAKQMHEKVAARCPGVKTVAVDNAPAGEQFFIHECYCDAALVQDLLHAMNRISETMHNAAPSYSEALLLLKRCFRLAFKPDVGRCRDWAVRMAMDTEFAGEICGRRFRKGEAMGEAAAKAWIDGTMEYSFGARGKRSGGEFWSEFDGNIRFYFYSKGDMDDKLTAFEADVKTIDAKYSGGATKAWTDATRDAVGELLKKTKYLTDAGGDPWIELPQPDSRGLPVYMSAAGTNHCEAFNLVVDKPVASNNTGGELATALIIDRTIQYNNGKLRRFGLEFTYFHHNRRLAEQVNLVRAASGLPPKYSQLLPLRALDSEEVVVSGAAFDKYRQPEPPQFRHFSPAPAAASAASAAAAASSVGAAAAPPPAKKKKSFSRDAANATRSIQCSVECLAKRAGRESAVGARCLDSCPKKVAALAWKAANKHKYS